MSTPAIEVYELAPSVVEATDVPAGTTVEVYTEAPVDRVEVYSVLAAGPAKVIVLDSDEALPPPTTPVDTIVYRRVS